MGVVRRRVASSLEFHSQYRGRLFLIALGCILSLGCSPAQTDAPAQADAPDVAAAPAAADLKVANSNDSTQLAVRQSPAKTANTTPVKSKQQATSEEMDDLLFQKTTRAGVDYLLQKGQAEDGSFSKQLSPAVTALCTSALIEHRIPIQDPRIQKSLKYLESIVKPDGGIYAQGSNLRNYETSVSLMCFRRANADGKYDQTIEKAIGFLKGIQWDDGEGHSIDSTSYGGQGYGSHQRPDASNTSFYIDALKSESEDPESEALQKAALFMSRCQNLPSPHNTAAWTANVSDEDRGGFIYTGVGEGESKAGETPEGGLRSYASMTYAGLKSFLYAGISKDDIRVKAAMDWIGRHYDLTSNPGMGQQGLYYYYHVFAKALEATGENVVVDADDKPHDWRNDLTRQLSKLQRKDGSWTNPADRWYEGDPNLVTAYALMALSYCDPPTNVETAK